MQQDGRQHTALLAAAAVASLQAQQGGWWQWMASSYLRMAAATLGASYKSSSQATGKQAGMQQVAGDSMRMVMCALVHCVFECGKCIPRRADQGKGSLQQQPLMHIRCLPLRLCWHARAASSYQLLSLTSYECAAAAAAAAGMSFSGSTARSSQLRSCTSRLTS
jgi:hypothetical protein